MDTYNICWNNLKSVEEAVGEILSTRNAEKPFDLSVSADDVKISGDIFHCHDTDFEMLESAKRSLNDMFRIPVSLFDQLSPEVVSVIYNDLMSKKPKMSRLTLRCIKDGQSKEYVRVVLQSKHGIVDDHILFPYILKKIPSSANLVVRHVWAARTYSAIRVIIDTPMVEASKKTGCAVKFGFDLVNSEVIPNLTWVKGVIELVNTAGTMCHLVIPKILPSWNSSDKSDIAEGMRKFFEYNPAGVDEMIVNSLGAGMMDQTSRSRLVRNLYDAKHLIRRDVQEIYKHADGVQSEEHVDDLLRADKAQTTPFGLAFVIGSFATKMDSYLKRSQLEFIPNIWFDKAKR